MNCTKKRRIIHYYVFFLLPSGHGKTMGRHVWGYTHLDQARLGLQKLRKETGRKSGYIYDDRKKLKVRL